MNDSVNSDQLLPCDTTPWIHAANRAHGARLGIAVLALVLFTFIRPAIAQTFDDLKPVLSSQSAFPNTITLALASDAPVTPSTDDHPNNAGQQYEDITQLMDLSLEQLLNVKLTNTSPLAIHHSHIQGEVMLSYQFMHIEDG